jgi:hypothetical protein
VLLATTNVFFRPFLFTLGFIYSALTTFLNGYFTALTMKYFGASDWCFAAMASAVTLPIYLVSTFVVVDLIEYFKASSSSYPPVAMAIMGAGWMFIAVPLSFYGAYVGFRQEKVTIEGIKVNPIRRRIPEQPWYLD